MLGGESGGGGGGGSEVVMGSSGGETSSIMAGIGGDEKVSGGVGGGGAGEVFEGDRSTGGNRWPRQETIALLKIRSDMDVVFRDSSLKGPLWEEVSRKMAELGYHRSAKKCKEKFENVYKYHKRTKEGRVGKADGKNYRFFDQLEALEQHQHYHHHSPLPPLPPPQPRGQQQSQAVAADAVPVTMVMPAGASSVTVPSSPHPISVVHVSSVNPQVQQHVHITPTHQIPPPQHPMPVAHPSPIQMENSTPSPSSPSATATPSPSPSSSSTSSDEELLGRQRKRKRKWKDFFDKLMKEVMDKQEELQKRFLEAVEKREHDRIAREEVWKMQEVARLNREHELLVQERSMAAAKDAALISFLQKLSDQQQIPFQLPVQIQTQPQSQPQTQTQTQTRGASQVVSPKTTNQSHPQSQPQPPPPQPSPQPQAQPQVEENPVSLPPAPQPLTQLPPQQAMVVAATNNLITTTNIVEVQKTNGNGDSHNSYQPTASSSRWPKAEVQALINLRTSLDQKYQENGPKGPLWEEISAAMKKLGYNRNAKRCKEKWENINKYFKKVKESNKKRPEDSKTCPYFHQLDALYREKSKMETTTSNSGYNPGVTGSATAYTVTPIMAQPEQQWPSQPSHHDDPASDNSDDDDGEEEDDDDQGSGYEIVPNNAGGSMAATTTTATTTATAG